MLVLSRIVTAGSDLSFEDRVVYQKAIEEVYWKRTIWPAENQKAKPRLTAVMSKPEIRAKVSDYVAKSEALRNQNRSIKPEDLQAEINRMATETI